ncbi:sugar ABC transporter [Paralcaligenes sp. KSB-10]|uniref:sugar ABC transporter n=1 Tax=Paralcaligenes sp. KSB-10 TaxID=2901142 RepID=UPI001E337FE8|nr:sugar ABC transporter [Paralcaligenes sp. KSB-10]UHL63654.1 sugar ABC transporter [Paralcaligenes sp. KSB-10]
MVSLPGHGVARAATVAAGSVQAPNIAFYYQSDLPVDELQAFDTVVIDPARAVLPQANLAPHTAWFARLDLSGLAGKSHDVNAFVSQTVGPLWEKGYRGFLLDDGAGLDENAAQSDAWLGQLMKAIHAKYPQARLMLRNHLGLVQANAADLYAAVVDSLYQKQNGYGSFLAEVPQALRANALKQIKSIQAHAPLPVVAIDYCAVGDQTCRRNTARRLTADGVTPFVTAPGMATVGVGRIEVMPRKILLVQTVGRYQPLDKSVGAYSIAMPLNYLGYDIQYADINAPLPGHITNDRYAGIVVAIDRAVNNSGAWRQWLLARIHEGMRVAVFNQFGFPIDVQAGRALGLEVVPGTAPANSSPQVVSKAPMMGFEIMPKPDIRSALGIRVGAGGRSLLRLNANNYIYDAAGLTSWGGYVLDPYTVVSRNAIGQDRWAIQPIDFLRQALALPDMPVPDLTTENGRRLMFTHVDGDGFASRGEFAGATNEYSGQILYNQIFTKYRLPMTVSVIEGEVGSSGMYPKLTPVLEPIARKIFALPNVEIGSHTYSHPFYLEQVDSTGRRFNNGKLRPEWRGDTPFSLDIPHYDFSMEREIQGSIDYINHRLAPPGKSVVAVLWPGDAAAPPIALRLAAKAGVLNINGGDTIITKNNNSWTNIAPYGLAKGDRPGDYQVYAGVMNENVYTNDWLGPYYGYDRVLETFALTDKPIRFKPIDIYYHFYSGTKTASLKALHTVFNAVLKQPIFPVFTTEYLERALDWRRVAVAREGNRWVVRSGQYLRELRWPGSGVPDLSTASDVSGYLPGPGGLYIHMGGDQASFAISPKSSGNIPYIAQASGFVRNFERTGRGMQFEFGGYYKPFVQLADAGSCRATIDGRPAGAAGKGGALQLSVSGNAAKPVSYHSIKVNCE